MGAASLILIRLRLREVKCRHEASAPSLFTRAATVAKACHTAEASSPSPGEPLPAILHVIDAGICLPF